MKETRQICFKDWIVAVRPWSFPASVIPVIVVVGFLFWRGYEINWLYALWALLTIVLFHAAGNTWSDLADFRSGVDNSESAGARSLTSGLFSAEQIRTLSIALLSVACVSGLLMVFMTGLPLLWIGLAGVLCTLAYPQMKYRAMGDLAIGLSYAVLPALGTSYVSVGMIDYGVLLPAIPIGMITIAILHANNTRDIETDRNASISTVAIRLGHKASAALYCGWVIGAFAGLACGAAFGFFPWWSLISFISFPLALSACRLMLSGGAVDISHLDERTAQLQLLFGLLFTLSFFIPCLI